MTTIIDSTATLERKFQRRQRDALTLAEMARQARGAAARWAKRSAAYARVGEHREANDADAEADSLWQLASDLDQEVQDLRSAARRHSTIKVVQSCSVAKYLEVLSHELVRYDVQTSEREAKRGRANIYRLGLLLEALGKVRVDVGNRTSDTEADKAGFRMAMYQHFERDFPPVKKVVKQLEAGTCKIR